MSRIVTILAIGMALVATGARAESATDRSGGADQSSQYLTPGSAMDHSAGSMSSPGSANQSGSQMSTQGGGTREASVLRQHFMQAHASYDNRNYTASAEHLRQASAILAREAANASGDVADNLRGTAKDLDKLAENIQRGKERSWDNVNDKIGDAYKNMSDFNYQKAQASFERYRASGQTTGRDVETGNALNAAAQNLEDWAAVTGRTLKSGTRTAVDTTRDLAGKMISGTGWATEKAGGAINSFGESIREFGRDVRRRNEPAPAPGTSVPPSGSPTEPSPSR